MTPVQPMRRRVLVVGFQAADVAMMLVGMGVAAGLSTDFTAARLR